MLKYKISLGSYIFKVDVFRLLVSIIICQFAGAIGAIFTSSSLESWYLLLEKPVFNPPSWIFFPVWTTLYTLMGISLYLVWEKGLQQKEVKVGIILFGLQLGLNILWSFLFFGLQSPYYAFLEILLLWLAILLTAIQFWNISKTASLLFIPYILWVSFAALLNYQIWVLNP
ncbi:MAG: tryptophan-rich sensory protein [Methanosarcina sp.]|uniref:TspO/MBR family protein n=1 Tax=Methanosarcina sp. TaxID=2213 RepID=UPI0026295ECD|nr:TspO/MBR family protein [Methanosarcina sp.]MDD3247675.1 tryptophan-rich sensory protein [Methanosarcina sp.]MDD4248758.1 tryptophan-rich sensory protein [Methanosarcina sp.]